MPRETVVFTSWKEIASYLGMGVRTVQRWEVELGLPVQRPDARSRGRVRISKEELDEWVSSRWVHNELKPSRATAELKELRRSVAKLNSENEGLRREIAIRNLLEGDGQAHGAVSDEMRQLIEECERVLQRTDLLRQQLAETVDLTMHLRYLLKDSKKEPSKFQ